VKNSLKTQTREKRTSKNQPRQIRITDHTNIEKIGLSDLLSHPDTKQELTQYLAEQTLKHYRKNKTKEIHISAGSKTENSENKQLEFNNHEEADTIIILHASRLPKNINLYIDSPDTDVALLLIFFHSVIPKNTYFITGTKNMRRTIPIAKLCSTLTSQQASAILGMHACTGSDTTGKFAGRSKESAFKLFCETSNEILASLKLLGDSDFDIEQAYSGIEEYVCQLYRSPFKTIEKTRWFLFSNKQLQDTALPPTRSALMYHIQRAHYQTSIWKNSTKCFMQIDDPCNTGWNFKNDRYEPIMTDRESAPSMILELTKCNCKKGCASKACGCKNKKLQCTELCGCATTDCMNTIDSFGFEV
jgi:hypothetical protein